MTQLGRPELVTAHIARVRLDLPIAELASVNAYVILGDDSVTLVDPGWAGADNERALFAALDALGRRPSDIARSLVTHAHWDHVTQAAHLSRTRGIPLLIGEQERWSMAGYTRQESVYVNQLALLRLAGAPALADELAKVVWTTHGVEHPFAPVDTWLQSGDELDCGGVAVTALSTPGHTRGHLVFEVGGERAVLTGDHVLPGITPAVSLEHSPQTLPLASYLASLAQLLQRPDGQLLPAHGTPGPSVHARVHELLRHHEERLAVVRRHVELGAVTAFEVASAMTWTRRNLGLGELGTVHQAHAVIEVRVHLELLTVQDEISRAIVGDVETYSAT